MVSPQLNVESKLMHGHNEVFQDQLKMMHWLVEEQKKMSQGYGLLERILAGGPYDDTDYTRSKSKKRAGAALKRQAAGDASGAAGAGGGPTPETGCAHGDIYCKNLCRSCYQRWRRATVRVGVSEFDHPKTGAPVAVEEEEDGDSVDGNSGTGGDGETEEGSTAEEEGVSYGRRGTKRRGPPTGENVRSSRQLNKKGPPTRKQPDLCVQCDLRPILCRSLCNGCYQRWHKMRKAAIEQGLPEVPCPSIAILAARKAAAEAAAAAAAAGAEGGAAAAGGAGGSDAAAKQEGEQQQEQGAEQQEQEAAPMQLS